MAVKLSMLNFKSIYIVFSLIALNACSVFDHYQLQQTTSNENETLNIYYGTYPVCKYHVLGTLESSGHFSKHSVFQKLVDESEKMGADGVIIDYLEKLSVNEYVAIGKAIRCHST